MGPKDYLTDIGCFFEYGVFPPHNLISIGNETGEEIDSATADRFLKGMALLEAKMGENDIVVILNSPGGGWYDGMAIYDRILTCKRHVVTRVYGHAMSMASVIFQAADERLMAPNATLMIHDGVDGAEGHARTFERQADESKRVRAVMYQIFLARIKQKHLNYRLSDVAKLCDHDTFLTAERAVELGLADGVMESYS